MVLETCVFVCAGGLVTPGILLARKAFGPFQNFRAPTVFSNLRQDHFCKTMSKKYVFPR